MSPQDIVRIYVPPPPPEELLYERPSDLRFNNVSSEGRSPESDCRTIIQRTPTELPGSVSTATITSQSMRSLNQQPGLESTLRDLALYSSQNSLRGHPGSTSSSRRGSMSRKSSAIVESELASECPHIRVTSGRDSRKNSLTQRHSYGETAGGGVIHVEYEAIMARANSNKPKKDKPKIMTSFEKLAQMNDTFYFGGNQTATTAEQKKQHRQSDDEAFSYSFQAMRASGGGPQQQSTQHKSNGSLREGTKCTSDYNIQYKVRDESRSGRVAGEASNQEVSGRARNGDAVGGGTADVKEMMKKKKQYDRFFTPDESEEEDDDDAEGEPMMVGGVLGKKKRTAAHKKSTVPEDNSSSPSSSSGASKSLLATPLNETQPLIMEGSYSSDMQYNFKHSRGVEQKMHSSGGVGRRRARKETTDEEEEDDEDGYDDEETDYGTEEQVGGKGTPASSPTYVGGAVVGKSRTSSSYYAHRSSSYIPIAEDFSSPPKNAGGDVLMMRSYQGSSATTGGSSSPAGRGGNKIRIRVNEKSK